MNEDIPNAGDAGEMTRRNMKNYEETVDGKIFIEIHTAIRNRKFNITVPRKLTRAETSILNDKGYRSKIDFDPVTGVSNTEIQWRDT